MSSWVCPRWGPHTHTGKCIHAYVSKAWTRVSQAPVGCLGPHGRITQDGKRTSSVQRPCAMRVMAVARLLTAAGDGDGRPPAPTGRHLLTVRRGGGGYALCAHAVGGDTGTRAKCTHGCQRTLGLKEAPVIAAERPAPCPGPAQGPQMARSQGASPACRGGREPRASLSEAAVRGRGGGTQAPGGASPKRARS